jgi:hypothetical protein
VDRPQRLRHDLGQHEDEQRHDEADQPDPGFAPDHGRLRADPRCSERVRKRVEREDRRERPIDVGRELHEPPARRTPLVDEDGDVRPLEAQEPCFEKRAQE